MAIFYIDFVNGNDDNDGSSWALAWKSLTNGATAARIAPGDEIRIAKSPDPTSLGQTALWSGIDRIYTEITPTSSTNATPIVFTKVGHGIVTGDIVQVYGHTVNTNANGKWKATRINADQFSLDNSVGNGVGGATGKFSVINHRIVQLTNAVTKNITNCDVAWTAGANCTATVQAAANSSSLVKEGTGSTKVVCAAGSGANQILAKYGLPESIDLSGYQQVSLWIYNSVAVAANSLELRLYSDAACTALVETIVLPAMVGVNKFRPIAVDKGSALSATVQGIALYAVGTQASKTFYLDNIIACKASSAADSITLCSLISKNIVNENGDHVFLGLQAIVGNWLFLDNANSSIIGMGYSGVTENVTTFKREAIAYDSASTNPLQMMSNSGVVNNNINVIGGFNIATNIRDGYTIIDGTTTIPKGWSGYGKPYVNFSFIGAVRCSTGMNYFSSLGTHNEIHVTNCLFTSSFYGAYYTNIYILNNGSDGLTYNAGSTGDINGLTANNNIGVGIVLGLPLPCTNLIANNNSIAGIILKISEINIDVIKEINFNRNNGISTEVTAKNVVINEITKCNYNGADGLRLSSINLKINLVKELNYNGKAITIVSAVNNNIYKIEQANYSVSNFIDYGAGYKNNIYEIVESTANAIALFIGYPSECYIYKGTFSGYQQLPIANAPSVNSLYLIDCVLPELLYGSQVTIINGRIYHHNYNNSGNHYIWTEYGSIENENAIRHTASGMAWKIAITNVLRTYKNPIKLTIAKVYCLAGSQAIIGCWVKKTHATDIVAKLLIDHYINTTVTADVSTIAAESTEWQQLIVTLTPTGDGVIEVIVETYWNANLADEFVYVDDVSVAQLI